MYLPTAPTTPATPIPALLVMDKVRVLLVTTLITLGLLFAVALLVSLLAAVVEVLAFLLPPSTASPPSVSIKFKKIFFT